MIDMRFVIGHPRSGTTLTSALLNSATPGIAAHEHLAALALDIVGAASGYYEGRTARAEILALLGRYGHDRVRVDCMWKLTWIADCLRAAYPAARVLHLVREPAENVAECVALDYYGRALRDAPPDVLRAAMVEVVGRGDVDLGPMRVWLDAFPRLRRDDWDALGIYERNCAMWTESHRLILEAFEGRPGYKRVRLTELVDPATAAEVARFLGLAEPSSAQARTVLAIRHNDRSRLADLVAALRRRGLAPPAGRRSLRSDDDARHDLCGDMARKLGV